MQGKGLLLYGKVNYSFSRIKKLKGEKKIKKLIHFYSKEKGYFFNIWKEVLPLGGKERSLLLKSLDQGKRLAKALSAINRKKDGGEKKEGRGEFRLEENLSGREGKGPQHEREGGRARWRGGKRRGRGRGKRLFAG